MAAQGCIHGSAYRPHGLTSNMATVCTWSSILEARPMPNQDYYVYTRFAVTPCVYLLCWVDFVLLELGLAFKSSVTE